MKSEKSVRVRVLTAADMHQSWLHYRSLGLATQAHRPDVVAIVGDALHAFPISFKRQFTTAECAKILAKLPVEHLIFVRAALVQLCRLQYYAARSVRTPVFPRKLNDPMLAAAA